jgi:hypothetical protein
VADDQPPLAVDGEVDPQQVRRPAAELEVRGDVDGPISVVDITA